MLIVLFGISPSPVEAATGLASCILTGLLVSFALQGIVVRIGYFGASLLGLFSLPLGAFAFGFINEIAEMLGATATRGLDHHPLTAGAFCAVFSLSAFYFYPLAILNTCLLRAVAKPRLKPETKP